MQTNKKPALLQTKGLIGLQLIRAQSPFVFVEMIEIALVHAIQPPARQKMIAKIVQSKIDLKINQIRPTIITQQDIFRFIGIDVSNSTIAQRIQQRFQFRKKSIRHAHAAGQGLAGDEGVHEPGCSDASKKGGDVGHIMQRLITANLPATQYFTEPLQRQAEEIGDPVDFDDTELAVFTTVKTRGGKKIMFNRDTVMPSLTSQVNDIGQVISA